MLNYVIKRAHLLVGASDDIVTESLAYSTKSL